MIIFLIVAMVATANVVDHNIEASLEESRKARYAPLVKSPEPIILGHTTREIIELSAIPTDTTAYAACWSESPASGPERYYCEVEESAVTEAAF